MPQRRASRLPELLPSQALCVPPVRCHLALPASPVDYKTWVLAPQARSSWLLVQTPNRFDFFNIQHPTISLPTINTNHNNNTFQPQRPTTIQNAKSHQRYLTTPTPSPPTSPPSNTHAGTLITCEPAIKSIIMLINAENKNEIIIEDLDETHLLIKDSKIYDLKRLLDLVRCPHARLLHC